MPEQLHGIWRRQGPLFPCVTYLGSQRCATRNATIIFTVHLFKIHLVIGGRRVVGGHNHGGATISHHFHVLRAY